MPTADATTNRTKIGRWVGAATAALAFTLLLGGLAARPASAQTWDDGTAQANNFIAWCFRAGGDPVIDQYPGVQLDVSCVFDNGQVYQCSYYPTVSCIYFPPTRTHKPIGDQLGGEGGVATSDPSSGASAGLANGQGGVMSGKVADAGGNDQPAAHQHGHHHGAKPKPGKTVNHQKARAGKK